MAVELLDRHELPAQAIYERDENLTATVPVHLGIMALSPEIRQDGLVVADARATVQDWYNEDMDYHLGVLRSAGGSLHSLRGYEEFHSGWKLDAEPDNAGFLRLTWQEGEGIHPIALCRIPVFLLNQVDESGEFWSFEKIKGQGTCEYVSRSIMHPEFVFMEPNKMRAYGEETDVAKIDIEHGVAEVMGMAFCSGHHTNLARALLLRDFAAYYLNQLAEAA